MWTCCAKTRVEFTLGVNLVRFFVLLSMIDEQTFLSFPEIKRLNFIGFEKSTSLVLHPGELTPPAFPRELSHLIICKGELVC